MRDSNDTPFFYIVKSVRLHLVNFIVVVVVVMLFSELH